MFLCLAGIWALGGGGGSGGACSSPVRNLSRLLSHWQCETASAGLRFLFFCFVYSVIRYLTRGMEPRLAIPWAVLGVCAAERGHRGRGRPVPRVPAAFKSCAERWLRQHSLTPVRSDFSASCSPRSKKVWEPCSQTHRWKQQTLSACTLWGQLLFLRS